MSRLRPGPTVRLVACFERPLDNAVATARTCYSTRGIVRPEQVAGDGLPEARRARRVARRDALARALYEAGHHTTLQHAHFQFAVEGVSRHAVWSFLHAHPFYNSEQVSQRYVEVRSGTVAVPPVTGEAEVVYTRAVERQLETYRRLTGLLLPVAGAALAERFPARARKGDKAHTEAVRRRAAEVARYVLPVGTLTWLYHTVSGVTLLRYHRLCEQHDTPTETRLLVRAMVDAVLAEEPGYAELLEEPVPLEETPEHEAFQALTAGAGATAEFLREFDASLAGRTSRLVGRKPNNPALVAGAVREVLGLPAARLPDGDALALVLDPAHNLLHGEALNLTTLSKLGRCLLHASYTFRKRLSHSADSQDQRHRLTPGSRPILAAHLIGEPDYVVPALVAESDEAAALYRGSMEAAWEAAARLRALGVAGEWCQYVLPNALAVRFTESADLAALQHKMRMRLCYNAQEEIWRASLDEAEQIAEVEPEVGAWLLPPCSLRRRAGRRPVCPEGPRFCGVKVWRLDRRDYFRLI